MIRISTILIPINSKYAVLDVEKVCEDKTLIAIIIVFIKGAFS